MLKPFVLAAYVAIVSLPAAVWAQTADVARTAHSFRCLDALEAINPAPYGAAVTWEGVKGNPAYPAELKKELLDVLQRLDIGAQSLALARRLRDAKAVLSPIVLEDLAYRYMEGISRQTFPAIEPVIAKLPDSPDTSALVRFFSDVDRVARGFLQCNDTLHFPERWDWMHEDALGKQGHWQLIDMFFLMDTLEILSTTSADGPPLDMVYALRRLALNVMTGMMTLLAIRAELRHPATTDAALVARLRESEGLYAQKLAHDLRAAEALRDTLQDRKTVGCARYLGFKLSTFLYDTAMNPIPH